MPLLGRRVLRDVTASPHRVSYTSVLTIVAFSTERYLAICHPLYAYSMKGLRRALLVIGSIWLVALGAAAPFGAYTKVSYLEFPPGSGRLVADSAFCAMLQEDVPDSYPVYELSMLFFFLLPMVALVVLYTRMAAALWWPARRGHALRGAVHQRSGSGGSAGRRSVVKMLGEARRRAMRACSQAGDFAVVININYWIYSLILYDS
ncbi:Neuropeptides capa receptor [Gryllus bimaculatus]|nr:Neuropeptides capa receptor [Gryllus bimaculatus]